MSDTPWDQRSQQANQERWVAQMAAREAGAFWPKGDAPAVNHKPFSSLEGILEDANKKVAAVAREDAKRMAEKIEDPSEKDLVEDDMINHPQHYNNGSIECIDYIEDQGFGYHVGCAVKYCARYRFKGTPIKDLKKAAWYLLRLADRLEKKNSG